MEYNITLIKLLIIKGLISLIKYCFKNTLFVDIFWYRMFMILSTFVDVPSLFYSSNHHDHVFNDNITRTLPRTNLILNARVAWPTNEYISQKINALHMFLSHMRISQG
jgi:hypothetical protein